MYGMILSHAPHYIISHHVVLLQFAYVQLKTILSTLLRRYELKLEVRCVICGGVVMCCKVTDVEWRGEMEWSVSSIRPVELYFLIFSLLL